MTPRPMMYGVNVRLPRELLDRIAALSERLALRQSEVIRIALDSGLDTVEAAYEKRKNEDIQRKWMDTAQRPVQPERTEYKVAYSQRTDIASDRGWVRVGTLRVGTLGRELWVQAVTSSWDGLSLRLLLNGAPSSQTWNRSWAHFDVTPGVNTIEMEARGWGILGPFALHATDGDPRGAEPGQIFTRTVSP